MSAPPSSDLPTSVDATLDLLDSGGYVANRALGTALYLALCLRRPLFLEGEAGVGKTEIAKVLAQTLDRDLIRLQCYEGLDVSSAVYEWNFARQMLEIRMAEALDSDPEAGRQKDLVDLRSTQRGAVDPVPGAEMAGDMPSEADQRRAALEADLFSERFLIKRPILRALEPGLLGKAPVLLIDELDRTDEPFEAFLLEV
ncbi:MAG: AAA family ATPase, partial [Rhodospirillaceae bacterium]